MKNHSKKQITNINDDSLIIKPSSDKYLYTNKEIFNRKWLIFIVNCALFLIVTMAVESPQLMQNILETKYNYTTIKYLFLFILVNFISCFTRRIINNFRKVYSNKLSLLIVYSFLIIGQALFTYGLYKDSYLIIIIGRLFHALSKDPLSILIISQISKVFQYHYGNIPMILINSTTIIGYIINCLVIPQFMENSSIYIASLAYLILVLIFIAIVYFIEYNLEINLLNETLFKIELNKMRSSSNTNLRKNSDYSTFDSIINYKFFDLRGFIDDFKSFSKEFYYLTMSGALSFLQIFNHTFMLNDYYTVNYNFSLIKSGNITAIYFTLCLILMPFFIYLSKLLKNKLNFIIFSNVCAIILSLFSLLQINFYYINILLHSIEYAILVGIILECFPSIVDQDHYYFAFEFNRILLYFTLSCGLLFCGLVVTIEKSSKFIFPFYLFISLNIISIKLLLKVKEHCVNL